MRIYEKFYWEIKQQSICAINNNIKNELFICKQFQIKPIDKMYKGPNGQMVYQQDIECVKDSAQGRGGIFIGNLQASQNLNTLKKNGIKGVLTSAKGVFLKHPKQDVPHHLYIPGEDHERFDLSKYFDQAADWIKEKLEETNVLVHCMAGVSRSVSLVIAYLIKHKNMNFEDAFFAIKSRRKIIHPNDGFKKQLKEYQQKLGNSSSSYSPQRRNTLQLSPQRSKYYNEMSLSRYNQPTSYARQSFSPTKNYEYKYFDCQERTSFKGRESGVRNPEPENSFAPSFRIDDIDKKIEQRRKSFNATGRAKAFSEYNGVTSISGQKRSMVGSMVGNTSINHEKGSSFESLNNDLDKRIAQIRKKYQDYTQSNQYGANNSYANVRPSSGSVYDKYRNFQERSTNVSGIEPYSSKNENSDYSLGAGLKARKMHSDYQKLDLYSGTNLKQNLENHGDYRYHRNRPSTSNGLRKILSYQQY